MGVCSVFAALFAVEVDDVIAASLAVVLEKNHDGGTGPVASGCEVRNCNLSALLCTVKVQFSQHQKPRWSAMLSFHLSALQVSSQRQGQDFDQQSRQQF